MENIKTGRILSGVELIVARKKVLIRLKNLKVNNYKTINQNNK